jgi:hypothetical protein
MTVSNEELVRKAVITAADALASAGKLNPAQSDKFIDYVIDETMLKDNARIVRFRNESMVIDKIGIGRRAAVPKEEAVAPSVRRGVNTSKVTLTPSEIMVPIEISDNFRELNIEGDGVTDRIIQMFAKRLGNDIEELGIVGDKLGPAVLEGNIVDGGSTTQYIKDSYLALQNGWQLLADSGHVFDADGTNVGLSVFSSMLMAMPTKFRRNTRDLRWFMSPDLAQRYAEKMTTRATQAGDEAARGNVLSPFGIPIVSVPLWDFQPKVVQHVLLSGTTAVSLKYKNVSNVVVTPTTVAGTPIDAFVSGSDYTLVASAGTIARIGGGDIGDGSTVKVTYSASPQVLLTHMNNFVLGIGRDVRIEKDRNIFKSVDEYAITAKVAFEIEEVDALVKAKNIGTGV